MVGKFITFEGGEGTGKSTQIKLLDDFLKVKDCDVITTKEPGGTELGTELRKLLITGSQDKMDAITEALLFFADRHHHLVSKIWPALNANKWVLSDRFADSTFAYQYYGHNARVSYENLQSLYKLAVGDFKPDLTFILDIEPEKGLKRSFARALNEKSKELRFENIDIEFHKRLRDGFLKIAKNDPQRCVVLNADKTIEELHQEIVHVITERFGC
ncbi:MAG: dTMP kinase [Alphaproteobacteria bacterium]|nr:dTMP kinase [Alphaproteobacteria bacterium]